MTNMSHDLTSKKGQGLIETLFIALLISVGVVGLMMFQHSLSYSSTTTAQQSAAINLATSEIETLRDYQVLSTTAGYSAYSDINSGTTTTTISGTVYTITWTVTAFTNPTYKSLDVSVTWTDRHNTGQTVRLISYVASSDPSTAGSFM